MTKSPWPGVRALRAAIGATFLLGACSLDTPGPDDATPTEFVTEIVDIMEEFSYRRDSVDWTQLRAGVLSRAEGATTYEQTHPALQFALEQLGDNHSWVQQPDGAFLTYARTVTCSAPAAPDLSQIPSDVGYLRVNAYSGSVGTSGSYTSGLQSAMQQRDNAGVVGWIIDLRGNGGGNMWPMLAALWPFLQGRAGFFVSSDSVFSEWRLVGARVYDNGVLRAEAVGPYLPRGVDGRIAVLIDNRVASSGEATAIAFKSRDNARFFGSRTCGLTTAIASGPVSGGYRLGLAVAGLAATDSSTFVGGITPEETITETSTLLTRAVAWVRTGQQQ